MCVLRTLMGNASNSRAIVSKVQASPLAAQAWGCVRFRKGQGPCATASLSAIQLQPMKGVRHPLEGKESCGALMELSKRCLVLGIHEPLVSQQELEGGFCFFLKSRSWHDGCLERWVIPRQYVFERNRQRISTKTT